MDWHHFVASSLKYIVVTVDGRGTGYKGRKLRNPVKDNLGHWETQDQINAAKYVLTDIAVIPLFIRIPLQVMGRKGIRGSKSHWYLGLGESSFRSRSSSPMHWY